MKVIHVVSSVSRVAAGVGEVVRGLAKAQAELGMEVSIVTLQDRWFEEDRPRGGGVRCLGTASLGPARLGFSPSLKRTIRGECTSDSVIHSHGVWMYPQLAARQSAQRARLPFVVSPHGMLEGWAFEHGSPMKGLAWRGWEGPAFHGAGLIHAMSESEATSIRRVTKNPNVVVIPPGVDVPDSVREADRRSIGARIGVGAECRMVLFLSRLHRKKGLDLLVEAWKGLARERPEWRLVIAGPEGDGSGAQAKAEVEGAGLAASVVFFGEASRRERDVLLDLSDLFVLPTRSENFGMVVAESLATGRPVVTTTETPWNEVVTVGCGWIVRPDAADLSRGMASAMSLSRGKLQAMGEKGRRWIANEFSWKTSGARMLEAYETAAARQH